MKEPYLVSVLTPIHNTPEPLVKRAFQSLQRQSCGFEKLEWVVLLHNCDEACKESVRNLLAAYPNVLLAEADAAGTGIGYARNQTLRLATGKWLFFLDADDEMRPDCIERVVRKMEESRADTSVMEALWHLDDKKILYWTDGVPEENLFEAGDPRIGRSLCMSGLTLWTRCYRRRFLMETGIRFDETLAFGEDFPFNLAATAAAKRVVALPGFCGYDYYAGTGMTGGLYHWQENLSEQAIAENAKGSADYFAEIYRTGTQYGLCMDNYLWFGLWLCLRLWLVTPLPERYKNAYINAYFSQIEPVLCQLRRPVMMNPERQPAADYIYRRLMEEYCRYSLSSSRVFPELSLDACGFAAKGTRGVVYALDEDTVVKVYPDAGKAWRDRKEKLEMDRTREEYLTYQTVLDSFNALESAETPAVICGEKQMTYRELVALAKRVALALQAEGVKPGDRVILSMSYSVGFICGFMAILYAGAAYVAIDREWPKERLDFIEKDSGAVMVLTDGLFERLSRENASGRLPAVKESDALAIYYTSGSTGNPKGAMIHEIMLVSVCMPVPENVCYLETYENCERIFSMGNFAYEAIIGDILFTLFCGKTLVLATEQERRDPALLGACMAKHRVDGTMGTPSMLIRYLDDDVFSAAFSKLKRVFLIGEAVSVRDADYIAERTSGALYDAFGCSEVGFFAYCKVRRGQSVTLEFPTYGGKLLILDEDGNAVRPGEAGELCVGGTLARYALYFGQPELTAQKYRILPAFGRVYRTGDQAVAGPDGAIRMTGRLDGMQKLHGQRLEPREIETAMESYPGIRQAAVAVRGTGADAVLCAWYTVREAVEEDALRRYLSDHLPGYMVPSRMMRMEELPLNTSGKLNRRALPDIAVQRTAYEAPLTERERLICEVFEKILRLDQPVGRSDNFFLLGGDSILGMLTVSFLWYELSLRYTAADLLRNPTPASLAAQEPADSSDAKEREPAGYTAVPEELKGLSEEPDVEAVLPVGVHTASYLFMERFGYTDANNIQKLRVLLNCAWQEDEFRRRVQALVQRHPALRSSFVPDRRGKCWQVFRRSGEAPVWYKNLEHLSPEAAERFVNGFWQVLAQDGNSWKAAYFVLRGGQSVLLFSAAHTITDGMSLYVVINDLCRGADALPEQDSLLRHRIRLIRSAEPLPEWIRGYYFGSEHPRTDAAHVKYGPDKWMAQTISFSREETEHLVRRALELGSTPYTYVQYCYAMALLEQRQASGLWLLTSESGRYADWKGDLEIVGDLTTLIPVWIRSGLTLKEFDETLTRLRAFRGISELDLTAAGVWKSFEEGIISNDFIEPDATVAEVELVDGRNRSGNSMTMRNGQLTIELRYPDVAAERERCRKTKETLEQWLKKENIT